MDSSQHAEQLTARVGWILSAVEWWRIRRGFYPRPDDLERAEQIRKAIDVLITRLSVLHYVIGEEIAVTQAEVEVRESGQKPVVDVLAGAEG